MGGALHRDTLDAQQIHEQLEGGGVPQADSLPVHQEAVGVVVVGVLPEIGQLAQGVGVIAAVGHHPVVDGQLLLVVGAVGRHHVGDHLGAHIQDGPILLRQPAPVPPLPGGQQPGLVIAPGLRRRSGRHGSGDNRRCRGRRNGRRRLRLRRHRGGRWGGGWVRGGRLGALLRSRLLRRLRRGRLGEAGREGLLRRGCVPAHQQGQPVPPDDHRAVLQQGGLLRQVAGEVPRPGLQIGAERVRRPVRIGLLRQPEHRDLLGGGAAGGQDGPVRHVLRIQAVAVGHIYLIRPVPRQQLRHPGRRLLGRQDGPGHLEGRPGGFHVLLSPAAGGQGEQQAGGQQAGPKALHRLSPHSVPRSAAGRLGAIRVRKRRISSGASFAYSTP